MYRQNRNNLLIMSLCLLSLNFDLSHACEADFSAHEVQTQGIDSLERREGLGQGLPISLVVKVEKKPDELSEYRKATQAAGDDPKNSLVLGLEYRNFYFGYVALSHLSQNIMNPAGFHLLQRGFGPHGFDVRNGLVAASFTDHIKITDYTTGIIKAELRSDLFKNLHTVQFSPFHSNRILVVSTGIESILEYDFVEKKVTWRWTSWNHGYPKTLSGLTVNLNFNREAKNIPGGLSMEHVENSIKSNQPISRFKNKEIAVSIEELGPLGIPKWMRTVYPNGAYYSENPNEIFASFFSTGEAVKIDRLTGKVEVVRSNLRSPHGFQKYRDGYVVSDTRRGRVLILNKDFSTRSIFSFASMPVKETDPGQEWIQMTKPMDAVSRFLATVDSRRSKLYVWDPEERIYEVFDLDPNSEVQEIF